MGLFDIKRTKKPMVSTMSKVMFGSGSLGYSIVTQTFYGLFMFFGNVAHNIPGTLMGIISLIGTIWDGAGDPIFGYMSDKQKSLMLGRRHGFLLVGTLMVAIINVMLWIMPYSLPIPVKFVWFLVAVFLLNTFSTVYQTPYHALGLELSGDYYERTVIQGVKTVFFLIGMIIPTVLIGVMMTDRKDLTQYQNLGYIASIVTLICGAMSFLGTYSSLPRLRAKAMSSKEDDKPTSGFKGILKEFFTALKIKDFRSLVLGYAISLMASAFITAVGLHFFQFTFLFDFSSVSVLLGALFVMTIVSQPFWMFMAKKVDKKPSLVLGVSIALVGIGFIGLIFFLYIYFDGIIPDRPLGYLLPGMLVIGFGVGAMFSMPGSMMGDVIAVEQAKTGVNRTGTYNAFMTFAYKVSQGITSFIVGIMLDVIRFDSQADIQSGFVRAALGWLIIIGVGAVLIGGLFFYTRYAIYKKDVPYNEEPVHNLDME